ENCERLTGSSSRSGARAASNVGSTMMKWFAAFAIILLASGTLFAAGEIRSVGGEGRRLTGAFRWGPRAAPGYWPIRFDIANLSENRTIDIIGRGTRWWNSGDSGTSEIHQSLVLKRGDRKRFSIPIPVFANNESVQFQIVENSKTL